MLKKVIITESYLTDIANAIRTKLGVTTTYKPSEMVPAIQSIPSKLNYTISGGSSYDDQEIRSFYIDNYTNSYDMMNTDTSIVIKNNCSMSDKVIQVYSRCKHAGYKLYPIIANPPTSLNDISCDSSLSTKSSTELALMADTDNYKYIHTNLSVNGVMNVTDKADHTTKVTFSDEAKEYFSTYAPEDMDSMFNGAINPYESSDWSMIDTSQCYTFSHTFTYICMPYNINVTGDSATNSNDLFAKNSAFVLNLSSWDTSSAETMEAMFYYSELYFIDVSNFNTSKVTAMDWMFRSNTNLQYIDISSFDTTNVTTMEYMFEDCTSLKSIDMPKLQYNSTVNINTDMSGMFRACNSLTTLNMSGFSLHNVSKATSMFSNCDSLKHVSFNSNRNTKCTDTSYMFYNCGSLKNIDPHVFITSKCTEMEHMFYNCRSLKTIPNTNLWVTSNVTNMSYMFSYCTSLEYLDLSNFNTSNVTTMISMFDNCSDLTSLDLSHFDFSNVTSMDSMFAGCSSLTTLTLPSYNSITNPKLTNMTGTFTACMKLTSIDLSGINTSNVTDISTMFSACLSLQTINMSKCDLSKVISHDYTFMNSSNITQISISGTGGVIFTEIANTSTLKNYTWHKSSVGSSDYTDTTKTYTPTQIAALSSSEMAGTWIRS